MGNLGGAGFRVRFALVLSLAVIVCFALAGGAMAWVTECVSVISSGVPGNAASIAGNLSADGRYVVLTSYADNFVDNDTNGVADVFVFDRQTGITERVSVATGDPGTQANGASCESIPDASGYNEFPAMSADGRYVVFSSSASNLVPGDTNGVPDIFIRDRLNHTTALVSVSSSGQQANGASYFPSVSADGSRVAFLSIATNLVAGDTNGAPDVFVRDIPSGKTYRANLSSAPSNAQAIGQHTWGNHFILDSDMTAWISGDGQHVAIVSGASNLVPSDTNNDYDVFVRDLDPANLGSGSTERVSVSTSGQQENGFPWAHCNFISYNGSIVTFSSEATNLVPGDTNGVKDVFVRDRGAGTTTRVSVQSGGGQFSIGSSDPTCSADGKTIGFSRNSADILFTGTIVNKDGTGLQEVGMDSTGSPLPGQSIFPIPSADGRYVALMNFQSITDLSKCRAYVIDRSAITIADAKSKANDTDVIVSGGLVTAAFGDKFYFQQDGIASPDRGCGIQVKWYGAVERGKRYVVTGAMKTDSHDERYILATDVDPLTSEWTVDAKPLGMRNKDLGGSDWKTQAPGNGEGQIGITGCVGINNIGLLVKIWGRVKEFDPASPATWFVVDDGSGIDVRCEVPSGAAIHKTWDRVIVTGINRIYKDGARYTRRISVRDDSDVQILSENPPGPPPFVLGSLADDMPAPWVQIIAAVPDGATELKLYKSDDKTTWTAIDDAFAPDVAGTGRAAVESGPSTYFRVTALNSAGESAPSEIIHARPLEVESNAIIVDSPVEHATGVSRTPTISWHPNWTQSVTLKSYDCEVHTPDDSGYPWGVITTDHIPPTSLEFGQTTGVMTHHTATGSLAANSNYFIYMGAIDTENWMFAHSHDWHFTTGTEDGSEDVTGRWEATGTSGDMSGVFGMLLLQQDTVVTGSVAGWTIVAGQMDGDVLTGSCYNMDYQELMPFSFTLNGSTLSGTIYEQDGTPHPCAFEKMSPDPVSPYVGRPKVLSASCNGRSIDVTWDRPIWGWDYDIRDDQGHNIVQELDQPITYDPTTHTFHMEVDPSTPWVAGARYTIYLEDQSASGEIDWHDPYGAAAWDDHADCYSFGYTYEPPPVLGDKRDPDGSYETLTDMIVTATFDDCCYLEREDRLWGIRASSQYGGYPDPGTKVKVWGTLLTNSDGERYLDVDDGNPTGSGKIRPLLMPNKAVGGGSALYDPDTGAGQMGITGVNGIPNIGLLVRTTGVPTYIDDHTFTIDDGSGVALRCETPLGIIANPAWRQVAVTGISSIQATDQTHIRLLKVTAVDVLSAVPSEGVTGRWESTKTSEDPVGVIGMLLVQQGSAVSGTVLGYEIENGQMNGSALTGTFTSQYGPMQFQCTYDSIADTLSGTITDTDSEVFQVTFTKLSPDPVSPYVGRPKVLSADCNGQRIRVTWDRPIMGWDYDIVDDNGQSIADAWELDRSYDPATHTYEIALDPYTPFVDGAHYTICLEYVSNGGDSIVDWLDPYGALAWDDTGDCYKFGYTYQTPPPAPPFVVGYHTPGAPQQSVTISAIWPQNATGLKLYQSSDKVTWQPTGLVPTKQGSSGHFSFDLWNSAYYAVTAINAGAESGPSQIIHARPFETETSGIVIDTPANGMTDASLAPLFSWYPTWTQTATLKSYMFRVIDVSTGNEKWAAMTAGTPPQTSVIYGQAAGLATRLPANEPLAPSTAYSFHLGAVDTENWQFATASGGQFTTGSGTNPPVGVTGRWEMTSVSGMEGPGPGVYGMLLAQQGSEVQGAMRGMAITDGAISDGVLTGTIWPGEDPGDVVMSMTQDGDTLSGTWTIVSTSEEIPVEFHRVSPYPISPYTGRPQVLAATCDGSSIDITWDRPISGWDFDICDANGYSIVRNWDLDTSYNPSTHVYHIPLDASTEFVKGADYTIYLDWLDGEVPSWHDPYGAPAWDTASQCYRFAYHSTVGANAYTITFYGVDSGSGTGKMELRKTNPGLTQETKYSGFWAAPPDFASVGTDILIPPNITVGSTIITTGTSNDMDYTSETTVTSVTDTAVTPAGTFNGCLKMTETITYADLDQYLEGAGNAVVSRSRWFAKAVGPVKYETTYAVSGGPSFTNSGLLQSYSLAGSPPPLAWWPLALNSTWVFRESHMSSDTTWTVTYSSTGDGPPPPPL